jgi:hypothetical protein
LPHIIAVSDVELLALDVENPSASIATTDALGVMTDSASHVSVIVNVNSVERGSLYS